MKQAVIYVRVSSKEQKQEGYSIPAQKKLLWDYAVANGFKVAAEFEDDETAKSAGRKGFGEMVQYLKDNKDVESILVEKTDRLYRNFKDYVTIDELGVTVFLIKENEKIGKGASSHQKFMHGIKVLMAKNYVDNLSEEIRKGLNEKAESGVFPGSKVPLGYLIQRDDSGKAYPVVDEKNREVATQMFNLYATGTYSLESLLIKLKNDGLLRAENFPRRNKLKIYNRSSLYSGLRNPLYYGDYIWKGKLHHGSHEPLISKDLWDKVQEMLDRFKSKKMTAKYNTLPFVFKGWTCGECGRTMTGERKIKKSGKVYHYYRCTKFNSECGQGRYAETELHKQMAASFGILESITDETVAYVAEGLKESLYLKRDTEDRQRKQLEEDKSKLQQRLSALYEDRLDRVITQEFYNQKFEEYSTKIKDLDKKISKYTITDINYYELGSNILGLAQKAAVLYKKANDQEKRELLSFLLLDSQMKDQKVLPNYKKPFDRVLERAQCADWWSLRNDFRTLNWPEIAESFRFLVAPNTNQKLLALFSAKIR